MANRSERDAFMDAARAQYGVDAYASEPNLFDVACKAAGTWLEDRSADVAAYQEALHRASARARAFKPPGLTIDMLAVVAAMAPNASRGRSARFIADELRRRFGTEPGLSREVAADVMRYVAASVTAARDRKLSPTYRWRYFAVRVGCGHADREGQVSAWDDPPPDGHPGQAVGCMCLAEGVFPDFDDLRDLFEFRERADTKKPAVAGLGDGWHRRRGQARDAGRGAIGRGP